MSPIRTGFTILHRRGPGYFWYLVSGWLIPRLLFRWRSGFAGRILMRGLKRIPNSILRERARSSTPCAVAAPCFTSWASFPVATEVRAAVEAARANNRHEPLLIGRIDNDGRFLGLFGELPGFTPVTRERFVERTRFDIGVVLCGDALLIRKDYRGDSETFVREWAALTMLSGKVNVPAVHHVDEVHTVLYKNLIRGRTVREMLVGQGAKILLEHTRNDPELACLDERDRIKEVWRRGRQLLPDVLRHELLSQLGEQLDRAHAAGVLGMSVTWGNVVIDEATATPWFIDLDKAHVVATSASIGMQLLRDRERELFNELYGTKLLTEASVRVALVEQSKKLPGWYAPIDFGYGLSVGGFWGTDNGTGRWAYLNGPVLERLLVGRRVLDLGSNNGIMPLMMLRAGAREVVGVEYSAELVESARLVHRIFEWRDAKRYSLTMNVGNMLDILHSDWGRFDIVTAYCSLYYLEPTQMAAVIRKAAELSPVMVVQAKIDTRCEAPENKAEKSSLSFLKTLLEQNGFSHVEVFAPRRFTRPLLVARNPQFGLTTSHHFSVEDGVRTNPTGSPRLSFLIATSWQDRPVSQQFRALGKVLVARGHRVVLLVDRHNRNGESHNGNPSVFPWPSARPTRFRDARFLSELIRQHRPDCLVANFGSVNLMTLVGWRYGVRHRIAWHHTLNAAIDADGLKSPWKLALLRWRKRYVWRFATAIAAVSAAAKSDLITNFNVPASKCHVIYNSLKDPLNGSALARTLSGENRILCVGRFDHCKGQDILLHAAAVLRTELPQMRVEFLGDGPLRANCEKLAGELGITDCCHFMGAVSHERVLDAMAQSDVTVVPSRSEAFGLVAIESLAVATPVVAFSVGGLPEILGDELKALLVPPGDARALARCLKGLLENTSGYTELSQTARARFLREFEQGAAVMKQADWIESLTN